MKKMKQNYDFDKKNYLENSNQSLSSQNLTVQNPKNMKMSNKTTFTWYFKWVTIPV